MIDWDDYAANWDADEGARAYADAAVQSLERLLADCGQSLAGARVCDFGCGTGLLTERLAPRCASIDAVDSSDGMQRVLQAKVARLQLTHVRTLAEVSADGEPYDLVVCSSVCGFLPDYPATVVRLASRLRPGGMLVQWDWELDPDEAEPSGLTRDGIRQALEGAGLDVVAVETAFTVTAGQVSMRPLVGVGMKRGAPRMAE